MSYYGIRTGTRGARRRTPLSHYPTPWVDILSPGILVLTPIILMVAIYLTIH